MPVFARALKSASFIKAMLCITRNRPVCLLKDWKNVD